MRKILFAFLIAGLCQITFSTPAQSSVFAAKKHQNTPQQEYLYQQKILKQIEKDKYNRSLMPPSGFMLKADYEALSKDVPTSEIKIPEPKLPNDIKMKYIPQPIFKVTRYNDPPGTPELRIERRFRFDRQENGPGITSPDRSMMVYPAIYYYAISKTTAVDLFVVPLDQSLPDVDRILRANVVRRNPIPILSTDKNINQDYTFRTMTPIDFSPDSLRLVAKEKLGNTYDGIWKTNLWVYDFETKTAKNLGEIRDAIRYYWYNTKGILLDDKRWDIYPLGFDANDPTRIIVTAYGYTGTTPKFLGTWSIDYKGERSLLISLFDPKAEISISGLKLVKIGVVNPVDVSTAEKAQDKTIKQNRKKEKKAVAVKRKQGKQALNKKLHEMDKQVNAEKEAYKKQQRVSAPTATDAKVRINSK